MIASSPVDEFTDHIKVSRFSSRHTSKNYNSKGQQYLSQRDMEIVVENADFDTRGSDLTQRKVPSRGEQIRRRSKYLRPRMEHATDIIADGALHVMEGAVVPLRMPWISPERLRPRLHRVREQERGQEEGGQGRKGTHSSQGRSETW